MKTKPLYCVLLLSLLASCSLEDPIQCVAPGFTCDNQCVVPNKEQTCGAVDCNHRGEICQPTQICGYDTEEAVFKCMESPTTCESFMKLCTKTDVKGNSFNYCLNPISQVTCGATKCDETGDNCNLNHTICTFNPLDQKYECNCPGFFIGNQCINAASNDSCGANETNPKGTQCAEGLSCKLKNKLKNTDPNEYECQCTAASSLTCINEKTNDPYCIDTHSDIYCGATSCDNPEAGRCSASEQCVSGQCICKTGFANCNDTCIDPWSSLTHCGAKGDCYDKSEQSENFMGIECKSNETCNHGKCECNQKDGYIAFGESCIHPSQDEYCGFNKIGEDYVNCSSDKSCQKDSKAEYGYSCQCKPGTLLFYDSTKCIDPMNNATHCGANEQGYGGENCMVSNKVCVNGRCSVSCPDGQAFCNGKCIDKAEYHVNDDCSDCDNTNYCFSNIDKIAPFNYEQCKTIFDVTGIDTTELRTIYHCGNSCDAKPCGAYTKCVNNDGVFTCECTSSSQTQCGDDCLDLKLLHMTACETCAAGWANCDNNWATGCETYIVSDKENCGACGKSCTKDAVNISAAYCDNGQCKIECNASSLNCDNNISNGCEIADKYTNISNCGACGKVCDSERSCENGLCCINKEGEIDGNDRCCSELTKYSQETCIGNNFKYRCAYSEPDKGLFTCHQWHEVED